MAKNTAITSIGGSSGSSEEEKQRRLNEQMRGRSGQIVEAKQSAASPYGGVASPYNGMNLTQEEWNAVSETATPYRGVAGSPTAEQAIAHEMGGSTTDAANLINSSAAIQNAANAYETAQQNLMSDYQSGANTSASTQKNTNALNTLKDIVSTITANEPETTSYGGGTTSGGNNNASYDTSAYQAYLNSALNSYQQMLAQQQEALRRNYEDALGRLNDSFNSSRGALQNDSDEALRQAYISYMLGQKNMQQELSNAGINGGAAESVLANLYNNYGNNRRSIRNNLASNLADLASAYNEGVANLSANYNNNNADALANYQNNLANVNLQSANNLADLMQAQAKAQQSAQQSLSGGKGVNDDGSRNLSGLTTAQYNNAVDTISNYVLQNNKSSIRDYLAMLGLDEASEYQLLLEAGISDPASIYETVEEVPVINNGGNANASNSVAPVVTNPAQAYAIENLPGYTAANIWGTNRNLKPLDNPIMRVLSGGGKTR